MNLYGDTGEFDRHCGMTFEIQNQSLYHGTDNTHCMSPFNVGVLMCNTNFTVLVTAT